MQSSTLFTWDEMRDRVRVGFGVALNRKLLAVTRNDTFGESGARNNLKSRNLLHASVSISVCRRRTSLAVVFYVRLLLEFQPQRS